MLFGTVCIGFAETVLQSCALFVASIFITAGAANWLAVTDEGNQKYTNYYICESSLFCFHISYFIFNL